MRSSYAIYKVNSGEILRIAATATPAEHCIDGTESWVEGSPDDRFAYVLGGSIVDKPTMPATIDKTTVTADGIDFVTISNLPNPSTVSVSGQTVVVEDGTLTIKVGYPRDYLVEVESWPYLNWEVTIHGT